MSTKYEEEQDASPRPYRRTRTRDADEHPPTEKYSNTSTISNLTGDLRGYSSSGTDLGEICWLPVRKAQPQKASPIKRFFGIFKHKRKKQAARDIYSEQNSLRSASVSDHTLESIEEGAVVNEIEEADSREHIEGERASCSSLTEKCELPPNSPRGDEILAETSEVNQKIAVSPPDSKPSDHMLECRQGLVVVSDIPHSESSADSPGVTLMTTTHSLPMSQKNGTVVSSLDAKQPNPMLECCQGLVVVSEIPSSKPSASDSPNATLETTTHTLSTSMHESTAKPPIPCFPVISPPEDFQANRTPVSIAPSPRELPCPSQKPPEADKSEWKRHCLRVELSYDGRSLEPDEKKWLERQITGLVNVLLERGNIPKNLSVSELTKNKEPTVSAGAQPHSICKPILETATNVPGPEISSFEPHGHSRTMKLGGIFPMMDGDDVDEDTMLLRMGLRDARLKYRGVIDELDNRLCAEYINNTLTGASSVNTFVTAREDPTEKELRQLLIDSRTQSGTDCTLVPSEEAFGPVIRVKIFEDDAEESPDENCSHFVSRSEPHIPMDCKELPCGPTVESTRLNSPNQNQLANESASSPHMFRMSDRSRPANHQQDVTDDPIIKCLIEESSRRNCTSQFHTTSSSSSTTNTVIPQTPKKKSTSNSTGSKEHVPHSARKTPSGTAFKTVVRSTPQELFKSTAPISTQVSDFRTVKRPFALRVEDDSLKIKIPVPSPRKVDITSSGNASKRKEASEDRTQASFAPISPHVHERQLDKNAAEMELSRRLGTTDVAGYIKSEKDVKKCSPGFSPSDGPVRRSPRHKKHASRQKEEKSKRGHHSEKKSRHKSGKERSHHERYSPPKTPTRRSPRRAHLRSRSPYVMHESLDDSETSASKSADSQNALESDTTASEGDRREYDTSPELKSRHRRHSCDRSNRRRSHTPPVRDVKPSHSSSPSSRRSKRASDELAFKAYPRAGKKNSRVTFDDTPPPRSDRRRSASRQSSPFPEKSPPRSSQGFGPMQFWNHGSNPMQSAYGAQFLPPRMNMPGTQFQPVPSKMQGAPPIYFPFPMQMTPFTNFTQYALSPMQTQGQTMVVPGDKTEASVQTKSAASSICIPVSTPKKAIQNPPKTDSTSRGDESKQKDAQSSLAIVKSETSKPRDSHRHSARSASNNSLKSSGSGHKSRRWRQCEREKEEGEAWWMPKDWAKERGIGSYGKTWEFEKEQFEKKEKELQIAKDANIEQIRMSRFVSL